MKKFYRKIIKEKWKYIMFLSILFIILRGIYTAFLYYKIIILNKKLENLDTQINDVEKQIALLKEDEKIKKYLLLKDVYEQIQPTKWSYIMRKMYDIIQKVDKISYWKFEINNFVINMEQLNLVWKVNDLSIVYSSGWIIDQFEELPFIKKMNIPYYKRVNNMFEFSLNANISINEYSSR